MKEQNDYYHFLKHISYELAALGRELEYSILKSPRMMLTHARTFIEDLVRRALKNEHISDQDCNTLLDRIQLLQNLDLVPQPVLDAIHLVRRSGNDASHNTRNFRYSEALMSWESLHVIVSWYMEVYGPHTFQMPDYQEPVLHDGQNYDVEELESRMKQWQKAVLEKVKEIANQVEPQPIEEREEQYVETVPRLPGETIVRTISFQGQSIEIPHFLRDAFLLPQRFKHSIRFMIALGGVQQARIMSELPSNLEGISDHVKRYNRTHEAQLFKDLALFIEEERIRRHILHSRPGEMFIFLGTDYIVMTEELKSLTLTNDNFKGFPGFLEQLNTDGINTVGDLPKELIILAKYAHVGPDKVGKLFDQLNKMKV